MKTVNIGWAIMVTLFIAFNACKREEPVNPYDEISDENEVVNPIEALPVGNFAWLHAKIFSPTCANSGCHDGSFEPHFNTISSSYNTLVNHPVIANDAQFSFLHRVVPGDVGASLLYERLVNEIPNTTGIMPPVVDANSDWNDRKNEYLAAIASWINAGAPDMFGNLPVDGAVDFPPVVEGLLVFAPGSTTDPYTRDPESAAVSPIRVPAAMVDVRVAVVDDHTPPQNMALSELRIATTINALASAPSLPLLLVPALQQTGFTGGETLYHHLVSIDLSGYQSGTVLFLRTFFDDGVQPTVTAIPNDGSSPLITSLFTLEIL
jgi:hypothetical protein